MVINPQNTVDEETQSGCVILWSQRSDSDLAERIVPVRYTCCGQSHKRSIYSLNRFRRGPAVTCIACITAPKPVPAERPICPRCGLYPVQRNWRGPSHQAYRSFCWSCSAPSSADPDARRLRYEEWKQKYGVAEHAHRAAEMADHDRERERQHLETIEHELATARAG